MESAYCSYNRRTRALERQISSSLHWPSSCDIIEPSLFIVKGVAIDEWDSTGTETGRDWSIAAESRRAKTSSEQWDISSPPWDSWGSTPCSWSELGPRRRRRSAISFSISALRLWNGVNMMRQKKKKKKHETKKDLPSLRDALERLFNFTVYSKPTTTRTSRSWRLNNITSQLSRFETSAWLSENRYGRGWVG